MEKGLQLQKIIIRKINPSERIRPQQKVRPKPIENPNLPALPACRKIPTKSNEIRPQQLPIRHPELLRQ